MSSPGSQALLAVTRPATAWMLCSIGLLAAFLIDYWATVGVFQNLGLRVATDFAGKPMPFTNTLEVSVQLAAPFALLGLFVAVRDWFHGNKLFAIAHALMNTLLMFLSLSLLGIL